ncbi:hypothetical protein ABI59_19000 [Acidobacteria bacterium Mor1]|nr:hypothetical protein ABI59_19000 [Acidobacteria bacterium Mor1]
MAGTSDLRQGGYSVSEMIVVIAVMAVLAGALAPVGLGQLSKARKARALEEIGKLSEAVVAFRKDVKTFPDRRNGNSARVGRLLTAGDTPQRAGRWAGPAGDAADHLIDNTPTGAPYPTDGSHAWRGPYLAGDLTDPWGNAYVISVAGLRGEAGSNGWILSAGPDGRLDTDDGDASIPADSDDLGVRLR